MKPPAVFTRRSRIVATINSQADGKRLPLATREYCALAIAGQSFTHALAVDAILACGLAEDRAEADELISEAEDSQ